MKNLINKVFSRFTLTVILIFFQIYWFYIFFSKVEKMSIYLKTGFSILTILMILSVTISNQNPAYKITWFFLIAIMPIVGTFLYLISYKRKHTKKFKKKINESKKRHRKNLTEFEIENINLDDRKHSLSNYIKNTGNFEVRGNTNLEYYSLGDYMFPKMLEDLKKAKKYIFLEYFLIADGYMWQSIRDILVEKSKLGVDVRIIYDDIGSVGVLPKNFKEDLEKYNIKVTTFNPLKPVLFFLMNNRDHRKIMIIDGEIAYNGGVNIGDEYINKKERFGKWKDQGIRIEGQGVINFVQMFLDLYDACNETKTNIIDFIPKNFSKCEECSENSYVQPFSSSPLDYEQVGENVYMDILYESKDYCYIFTPYLIIDHEMTIALITAAKRGVDVRIVVPNIPDKKIVYHLGKSYFKLLLQGGVKIYKYSPGFIHSKSFISDDNIGIVGTINMDYRSLYLHFECATLIYNHKVLKDIKKDFLETFNESEEVNLNNIKTGKIWGIYEAVLRVISPLF